MSGFLLIGLIVVVWLVVLAPLLLRGQKPIRKAGEAFDETRVILEGGSSVPMRRRPRPAGENLDDEAGDQDHHDDEYEIDDSPSIFRHRREDVEEGDDREDDDKQFEAPESTEIEPATESYTVAAVDSGPVVVSTVDDLDPERGTVIGTEPVAVATVDSAGAIPGFEPTTVDVIEEWNEEDHYPLDDSYSRPIDFMHHEERSRAIAEHQASQNAELISDAEPVDDEFSGELTQADVEFAERRRGRGYYDPEADRTFAKSKYIRRQRTLLGLSVGVLATVILGFVFGGGIWTLPALTIAVTVLYLFGLRNQVLAENALRARRIRRLRRSRMGVRHSADFPQRLRRPGAVVLELDDESPDFEGLETTYLPVEEHGDRYRSHRTRRVS